MDKHVRELAKRAAADGLYIVLGTKSTGYPIYWRVLRVASGTVVVLYGDCGNPKRHEDLSLLTPGEFLDAAGKNGEYLFKKVGFWSFAPANDPAAKWIELANKNPSIAGNKIYCLQEEVKQLRDLLESRQAR